METEDGPSSCDSLLIEYAALNLEVATHRNLYLPDGTVSIQPGIKIGVTVFQKVMPTMLK